jgi:hypothetical protein
LTKQKKNPKKKTSKKASAMSFGAFALSLSLLLHAAYAQSDAVTIHRSFLDKPVFTKLTIFTNPKNSSEDFLEAVETTMAKKTLYWVTQSDIRTSPRDFVFVAKTSSSVVASGVLDSTVPSSQRGEVVPAADAALTALFADTNTTNNAFAVQFGDTGAPSTKFLFRLGTDGKNDIVCVVARGADLGASEADSPVLSCAPVVAGTLKLSFVGGSPSLAPLVPSFFSTGKIVLSASDVDYTKPLRFTSVQRTKCDGLGSDSSAVNVGVIMLLPVKCNSSWTSTDGAPVKCSSGFTHAMVDLSAKFTSDAEATTSFNVDATAFGFNVETTDFDDASKGGNELPMIRIHRVQNLTFSNANPGATCVFIDANVNSFAISNGITSDGRFSIDADWKCPKDVCKQEDFDKFFAPSPIDFGAPSSAANNSILDCSAAGFGVLSCLSAIQSDECKGVGFASLDFGAPGAPMTNAPTAAPASLDGYCKCADTIFDCLLKAGCKRNAAAATAEQVMKCKAQCPDSTFCAASSIAMNGATLLFAVIAIMATMIQWN